MIILERNRLFFSSVSLLACARSNESIASLSIDVALALLGLKSSDPISPSRLVLISMPLALPPFQPLGLGAAPSTPSPSASSSSLSFEYPAAATGVPRRAKSSIDVGLTPWVLAAVGDVKWPPVWTVRLLRAAFARRLAATDVDVDADADAGFGCGGCCLGGTAAAAPDVVDALVGVGSDGMVPNGSWRTSLSLLALLVLRSADDGGFRRLPRLLPLSMDVSTEGKAPSKDSSKNFPSRPPSSFVSVLLVAVAAESGESGSLLRYICDSISPSVGGGAAPDNRALTALVGDITFTALALAPSSALVAGLMTRSASRVPSAAK